LHVALARVVRHLDAIDTAAAHDRCQLVERTRVVVRRSEQRDLASVTKRLEPAKVITPRDEIVHLLDLDPALVEAQLAVELRAPLPHKRGPDLGCDDGLFATPTQGSAEHRLRPSA